jgi:hypothetical protein
LTISLALTGNADARLDRRGVVLAGPGAALRYGGLTASDARGRTLRSWLAVRSGHLLVQVADRGAAYPIRIDPFIQQAELTASDGLNSAGLGTAVAVSGDTIVAGANGQTFGSGAVYVFVKPASGWANATQTAELTASDGATGSYLGSSVAISGDTIVAGAPGHSSGQGAAYVFVKPASGWANGNQTAELTAGDGVASDGFGSSVAISGDTVVAGAPSHQVGSNTSQGAGYVFVKPTSGWANGTQTAELTASDGAHSDKLGSAVAVSGNTAVAGAVGRTGGQGAAYVFVMPASGWTSGTQTAELTASDGATGDDLGYAVAVSGSTVVAGADLRNSSRGAAYVFVRPASGWANGTQTAELTASDGASNENVGNAVALSGDVIAVGAFDHNVSSNTAQGAAYVFVRPASGWANGTQTAELTASDGAFSDYLGSGVGVTGNVIVAGAYGRNSGQGAAYAFVAPLPTVTIATPGSGATYAKGQAVAASYSCAAPTGATITACAGPVASGAPIDTSTLGTHSFTVTASDSDGQTTTQSVSYTVVPPSVILPPAAVPPSITRLRQSASVWREGTKLARISRRKRPPVGTTFSFRLNEQARVTLHFDRLTTGRKVRGKCVRQSASNKRRPRCTRATAAGALGFVAHQGIDRVHFYGRLTRHKKLKPGRYSLTISATNTAGQHASARALHFSIVT